MNELMDLELDRLGHLLFVCREQLTDEERRAIWHLMCSRIRFNEASKSLSRAAAEMTKVRTHSINTVYENVSYDDGPNQPPEIYTYRLCDVCKCSLPPESPNVPDDPTHQ